LASLALVLCVPESEALVEFAFQHTVRNPVRFSGVGVHTGEQARVTLLPAPADFGVVFVRTDVRDRDNRIAVSGEAVCKTQLGTVITNLAGVTVSTIEHLMAALVMSGVDNVRVEIDGPEMPIMDGSSIDFIRGLDRVGLQPQGALRRFVEITDVVEVIEGDKRATLRPSDGFEVAFEIAFASKAIGRQAVDLKMDAEAFRRELADCRTFGFLHEVEALRAMGLARGGSMENVVVIDGDEIMNPEGLRRPDEFVRHKALDAIGDLFVLGAPMIGRFEGVLAGHALNNAVVRALLATPHAWRVRTLAPEMAEAV
jgi:UDP-3-O-[3-hydroxymyristoyl] N-acetylglucosamine deacetylase